MIRGMAGQKFDGCTTEGPDVRRSGRTLELDDFGGHCRMDVSKAPL